MMRSFCYLPPFSKVESNALYKFISTFGTKFFQRWIRRGTENLGSLFYKHFLIHKP